MRSSATGLVGAILTALVLAAGAAPTASAGVVAVVPNQFVRDCSNITRRCTGYYQTNGRFNPAYPSSYSTRWVWRPI